MNMPVALPMTDRHDRAGTPARIRVADIRRQEDQPRKRFHKDSLNRLAQSILAIGLKKAIIVRRIENQEHSYELIDGERRWLAHQIADIEYIEAIIQDVRNQDDQHLTSLVLNFLDEPHTPMEISDALKRQTSAGKSVTELATILGKSTVWVYQYLALQDLIPELQKLLDPDSSKEKPLGATIAAKIARASREDQLVIYERMMAENRTERRVHTVRKLVQESSPRRRDTSDNIRMFHSFVARLAESTERILDMPDRVFQALVEKTDAADLDRISDDISGAIDRLEVLRDAITAKRKRSQ